MITTFLKVGLAMATLLLAACGSSTAGTANNSLFATELSITRFLPDRLREVSGLAVAPDGRLFAHDDEIGVIYEINAADGGIVKWFAIGDPIVTGDFEGLTITPSGEFWLTTSTGRLYRFREGEDRGNVSYDRANTGLEENCEVEGVAYRAANESLILACKRIYSRRMEDRAALRMWPIGGGTAEPWGGSPDDYADAAGARSFTPSDVTIDAASGRILVLSSRSAALVELSSEGEVLSARRLGDSHRQAEGVAVMADGSLVVADEGGNDQPQLTRYARVP
ncbi:MAG: SdiA-regulated domain-containing protein [Hyphomonadaceae bacterium]